jgi:hypothetical protein
VKTFNRLNEQLSFRSFNEKNLTITLMDGSKWVINPGDISKVVCWTPTSRVVVKENESPIYPYKLVNLDTAAPDEVSASIR